MELVKIKADSNSYLIDGWLVIDTGNRLLRNRFEEVETDKVTHVIFTHLHYDHIGNFDLFPNARFFASKEEIEDFNKKPNGTVLDVNMVKRFDVKLETLEKLEGFEIIRCPGHTRGSIALWHPASKKMFSGDTIFYKGGVGRTDLPTSVPEEMEKSVMRLRAVPYEELCPGHEY